MKVLQYSSNCIEVENLKEEVLVLNQWINSIKDWVKKEVDDVNDDLESLETENFVLTHTSDEAFESLIILKSQSGLLHSYRKHMPSIVLYLAEER